MLFFHCESNCMHWTALASQIRGSDEDRESNSLPSFLISESPDLESSWREAASISFCSQKQESQSHNKWLKDIWAAVLVLFSFQRTAAFPLASQERRQLANQMTQLHISLIFTQTTATTSVFCESIYWSKHPLYALLHAPDAAATSIWLLERRKEKRQVLCLPARAGATVIKGT